ncbi:RNI-like protein [Fistulina hepatica ATCC 64428]|nr:RNI-like protein [Fistulina hepatica ATCC 64428]
MVFYRHNIPSNTSLSDEDIEDDLNTHSVFFPPAPSAQWKSLCPDTHRTRVPERGSPIGKLPPELLIHVLRNLHLPRDLRCCLLVSRTWCECSVELLWHKPTFSRIETLTKMRRVLAGTDLIFAYASFIRRLNFVPLSKDLKDGNFCFLQRCERLERLTLVNCNLISNIALERVLPSFPDLVALDLNGVVSTSTEAIVRVANISKRLQGINLSGCKTVGNDAVIALATNCPLLRRVKLSGLELLTDQSVSLLVKSCPLLLEIDLNHCELITDTAVRDIWMHSKLMREMRLAYCPNLTDSGFPAPLTSDLIAHADRLSHPFPRSDGDHESLPPLVLSSNFVHLRMMDLTGCAQLTDEAIDGIIAVAPKLRNLVLSKCIHLTDRAVETICKLGRSLHYLHLGHAGRITDRSVRTLARSCTRLRYVDFANCSLLTDLSVFELAALPKLRRIGLVRVHNLTDEAIYALAQRHATLERIHLSYCDQLTVVAVHYLLQKLHKLTHLSLTGVPAFMLPELQQFCREPPKLRAFLTDLLDHITEMSGTDDTEYDESEPDLAERLSDEEDDGLTDEQADADEAARRMLLSMSQMSLSRQPNRTPQARQSTTMSSAPTVVADDEPAVPPPVRAQAGSSRHSVADALPVVDTLPIVETLQSPPASDALSSGSGVTNQSNGAGFFRHYHDHGYSVVSPQTTGARTPDLDYAEIGHGRGLQGAASAGPSLPGRRGWSNENPRPPFEEQSSSELRWPHQEPQSPAEATLRSPQDEARTRHMGRSIRNTLTIAEQYASSFLFGRSQEGRATGASARDSVGRSSEGTGRS